MPSAFSLSTVGRAAAVLAASAAVAGLAGCGGDSDSGGSAGAGGGSGVKQMTTATEGAQIFKDATCASCHTLAAAGAEGRIGPNLDELKPSSSVVADTVREGDGSMPAFGNRLSAEQITALADYVSESAGQ